MKIEATAGRDRSMSVSSKWVYKLALTADTVFEHEVLGALYAMLSGPSRTAIHDRIVEMSQEKKHAPR